jgi:anti-sigma factor RsiW
MTATRQRIDELLIEQTIARLSVAEREELDALLRKHPEVDPHVYERVAAKVFLAAAAPSVDAMPAHLYSRIAAAGQQSRDEAD